MDEQNVIDYTELLGEMYAEMQTQTELLTEIKQQEMTVNGTLLGLGSFICAFVTVYILDFCWSCMRQWRKNILKTGV